LHEPAGLCLVLHAHLPFVRHPECVDFLEEDWLFEAISETYLPLIDLAERLLDDGVPYRLTLSVTPTLAAMLEDPLLQSRYLHHLDKLIELAAREVERTRWMPPFQRLALGYHESFTRCRMWFTGHHGGDLLGALRRLADAGTIELITSGATHGFLPLMLGKRGLWRAQVLTAVREHERHFGRRPAGIWLPECGFAPGVDQVLREAGIRFFFCDAHGILRGSPRPRFGTSAPVLTPGGVAAFGRDLDSSRQVWSSWLGYPGDFSYREFYRDVGWDLDYEYIRSSLHSDGHRCNLGIKYYRITGPGDEKQPYDFEAARLRAEVHAEHFLESRRRQAEDLTRQLGRPPFVAAPYDAELFGHWWYEGPTWLEFLLRKMAAANGGTGLTRGTAFRGGTAPTGGTADGDIRAVTPSEYLDRHPGLQVCTPSYSSWGMKGYAEHWLDRSNDWIYPLLHRAGDQMIELAERFAPLRRNGGRIAPPVERALQQAGREILLAQSSDWALILRAGTMTEYATRRTREHLSNFTALHEQVMRGQVDLIRLAEMESRHNLFPNLDWTVFLDEAGS
jgi:1,4-alpha-glucan branching enzyme